MQLGVNSTHEVAIAGFQCCIAADDKDNVVSPSHKRSRHILTFSQASV
jgi:hypothetical protein